MSVSALQVRSSPGSERGQSPSVLCVLPIVPVPASTGGALRALNLLQALDTSFDLTVLALEHPGQDAVALRARLNGRVVPVDVDSFPRRAFGEALAVAQGLPLRYGAYAGAGVRSMLARMLAERRFDVVHFDHPHMAQLLPQVKAAQPWARTVMDAHNVEACVVERIAATRALPVRLLAQAQSERIRRLESQLAREVDVVLACSKMDADELGRMGGRRVEVIPNTAPAKASAPQRKRQDLVFVGSMDWWPNADAAVRLVKEIWPLCRERLPGTRLLIVGRNPPPKVRALVAEGVIVTGSVESVQPYLESAWATAIPLRAGSGTRIKILEAWAAQVPVVATELAAEGLPFRNGENLLVAESAAEFSSALLRLHADETLRARLAAGGARAAAEFDAGTVRERIVALFQRYAAEAAVASAGPYTAEVYPAAMAAAP